MVRKKGTTNKTPVKTKTAKRKAPAKKKAAKKPAASKRKAPAKEEEVKKTTSRRRRKAAAPEKKVTKSRKKAAKKQPDELFAPELNLGELLWEYRARHAEWERAFAEANLVNHRIVQEKKDPKYKPLLDLMAKNDQVRAEIQRAGIALKVVQQLAANKLGITLEEFLNNCTVDHETGLVRFLD